MLRGVRSMGTRDLDPNVHRSQLNNRPGVRRPFYSASTSTTWMMSFFESRMPCNFTFSPTNLRGIS